MSALSETVCIWLECSFVQPNMRKVEVDYTMIAQKAISSSMYAAQKGSLA